jgi:hypothetical protein
MVRAVFGTAGGSRYDLDETFIRASWHGPSRHTLTERNETLNFLD